MPEQETWEQKTFREHTTVMLRELARKVEEREVTVDMFRDGEAKPDLQEALLSAVRYAIAFAPDGPERDKAQKAVQEAGPATIEQGDGSVDTVPVHETEGRNHMECVYRSAK